MQRAGQHLPGPFAADMSNVIALPALTAYSPGCERPGGGRARHRLRGEDAYRDGPRMVGCMRAALGILKLQPLLLVVRLSEL